MTEFPCLGQRSLQVKCFQENWALIQNISVFGKSRLNCHQFQVVKVSKLSLEQQILNSVSGFGPHPHPRLTIQKPFSELHLSSVTSLCSPTSRKWEFHISSCVKLAGFLLARGSSWQIMTEKNCHELYDHVDLHRSDGQDSQNSWALLNPTVQQHLVVI